MLNVCVRFEGTGDDGNDPLLDVFDDTFEKDLEKNAVGQDLQLLVDVLIFNS